MTGLSERIYCLLNCLVLSERFLNVFFIHPFEILFTKYLQKQFQRAIENSISLETKVLLSATNHKFQKLLLLIWQFVPNHLRVNDIGNLIRSIGKFFRKMAKNGQYTNVNAQSAQIQKVILIECAILNCLIDGEQFKNCDNNANWKLEE